MGIIKLSKPFTVDGIEYTELNLDYDNASHSLFEQTERVARGQKYKIKNSWLPESTKYRLLVASYLVGIPEPILAEKLSLRDGLRITNDVMGFFSETLPPDMIQEAMKETEKEEDPATTEDGDDDAS